MKNVKNVLEVELNLVQNQKNVLLVMDYGKVRTQQGFFTLQQTCPDCGGDGEMLI